MDITTSNPVAFLEQIRAKLVKINGKAYHSHHTRTCSAQPGSVTYEAAISQKDETALLPAPYGGMTFELYVDSFLFFVLAYYDVLLANIAILSKVRGLVKPSGLIISTASGNTLSQSEQASLGFRVLDVDTDNLTTVQTTRRLTRTRPLNDILGMSDTPEPVKFALRDRIFGWELHGKVVFKQQDDTANEKVEEGHVKTQVQGNALTNGGVLVITGSDYPLAMKLAASAMNLYSVLADVPLGFFLMTSSVLVVLGTPAYRRVRAGSSTTACVLLMVLRIAVVAENVDLGDILKPKGRYGIDEEHLLQPFGASIAAKRLEPVPDHVVIGLDPALWQKAVPDGAATDSFWLKDARCSHVASYIDSSRNSGAGAAHRASWQP
ncbi:hypothetical protein TruAng_009987 [Truncatella angustata]|nr:hypothetical protein TruAng_009987 [Truncatella angustata]